MFSAKREIVAALDGPLAVKLTFYMPRPKSHFGTGRNSGQLKQSAPREYTGRGDIDNLAKGVLDACNGVLFRDDAQVVELLARKVYADADHGPGCALRIESFESEVAA